VTNEKLDQILYPLVYAGDVGLPGLAGNDRVKFWGVVCDRMDLM
jgi:hypothetical protein